MPWSVLIWSTQMDPTRKILVTATKGVGRKISKGGGGATKKDWKIVLKKTSNSTILPLPWGSKGKNTEKYQKIALFILYFLNLYHVWKSRGPRPLLLPRCQRPWLQLTRYSKMFYRMRKLVPMNVLHRVQFNTYMAPLKGVAKWREPPNPNVALRC